MNSLGYGFSCEHKLGGSGKCKEIYIFSLKSSVTEILNKKYIFLIFSMYSINFYTLVYTVE